MHYHGDYGYIAVGNNEKLKVADIRSGLRRGNKLKAFELILQGEKDKKNICHCIDCSMFRTTDDCKWFKKGNEFNFRISLKHLEMSPIICGAPQIVCRGEICWVFLPI